MDFSEALKTVREGKKISREGWNGKDQYVYLVPQNSYPAQTEVAKKEFGDNVPYGPYLAIKTTQNIVYPWLATQSDLLSDDWCIVEQ